MREDIERIIRPMVDRLRDFTIKQLAEMKPGEVRTYPKLFGADGLPFTIKKESDLPDDDEEFDADDLVELSLPVRADNCLYYAGFRSITELQNVHRPTLLGIKNLGKGTLADIKAALEEKGFRHKLDDDMIGRHYCVTCGEPVNPDPSEWLAKFTKARPAPVRARATPRVAGTDAAY